MAVQLGIDFKMYDFQTQYRQKVVDYTDTNPPEKFLQKGVIAFQTYGAEGHAGWVKFRNIRVRPLD